MPKKGRSRKGTFETNMMGATVPRDRKIEQVRQKVKIYCKKCPTVVQKGEFMVVMESENHPKQAGLLVYKGPMYKVECPRCKNIQDKCLIFEHPAKAAFEAAMILAHLDEYQCLPPNAVIQPLPNDKVIHEVIMGVKTRGR